MQQGSVLDGFRGNSVGRLILFVLQLVLCWAAGLALVQATKFQGPLKLVMFAVAFAAIAYIVGLVAAELLQGVGRPAPRALASALIGAFLGLGIIFLQPYVPQLKSVLAPIQDLYLPLIGAVLGYHVRA
jgi:hypothetical protein